MINIINKTNVPKVILRYIIMNFLDMQSIECLLLVVKEMNVLDPFSKDFLTDAKKGFVWNCEHGRLNIVKWLYYVNDVNICIYSKKAAFKLCCKNGHLDVAKWL